MNKLYDKLDTIFIVEQGKIEDKGEDSFCCSIKENAAFTGVFDGSGGMGFRMCKGFSGKTEAYMASRLMSGAFYDWFQKYGEFHFNSEKEMIDSIAMYFKEAFTYTEKYNKQTLKVGGSLVKSFPTTAAIAFVQHVENDIYLHVIWAGDSRIYLFDANGLAQLSEDDVDTVDAFLNLTDDGAMNNVLSADREFTLHLKTFSIAEPTIIFSATDGCFGYIPSPMEFEYEFLDALVKADSIEVFKQNLTTLFNEVAADDYALGLMAFNFGGFKELQAFIKERYVYLKGKYIKTIESSDDESIRSDLWQEYKTSYERFMR